MFVFDGFTEHSLQAVAATCFAESEWICVCSFAVAMRVWLLWFVAALRWKWLANVAKFLVAPTEVASRLGACRVLDPVALAKTEGKATRSESNSLEHSWCAWAPEEKAYSVDVLPNVQKFLQG
eukprot:s1794_g21.t1